MKLLSSLILVHGALSFNLYGKTSLCEKQSTPFQRDLEMEALDEMHVFMEFERYLEFSMSVSMSVSMSYSSDGPGSGGPGTGGSGSGSDGSGSGSGGDGSGSGGNGNGSPSSSSTSAPALSPTASPTTSSSTSLSPTFSPSAAPSRSTDTEAPSLILAVNVTLDSLFECSDQGVVVASAAPGAVTTPVSLTVMYEVESMANSTDAFLDELESALFSIAIMAALTCNATQRRGLQPVAMRRQLTTSTTEMGSCNVTEGVDNSCFVLETNLDFEINSAVDPDYAAFLAYTALQEAMANYSPDEIDTVVRLTYLAPTPIDPVPATLPETRSSKPFFSPLAIGACAAMVAGSTLALYVWVHNRRTRNKRHVELMEDQSFSPVSFFSAERDPYEDA